MASTIFSAIAHKSRNFTATFLLHSRQCSSHTAPNRRNLFSRILPLGDPSISVVPVLDKWLHEGNAVNGFDFKGIIRTLRSRNRINHALQVSEWMSSKRLWPISQGDLAIQLDLIGRVHGADTAEKYFQNLSDDDKTGKLHGALLSCYVRESLVDKSLSQLQKMKDMGYLSPLDYNNIMCLYMQTNQPEKVPGVLEQMKEDGVSPNPFSYRVCLNSYCARSDLLNVEKLLKEMERQSDIGIDWITCSMVANFYIKQGLKESAVVYLKKCEDKAEKHNAVAYNHLISHYASLGDKKAMMRLWKLQKANCKKQFNRDYITMLGSLMKIGDLEQIEKLLDEWELSGNVYDFRVPNILLIGYSQNGLIEKGEAMLLSMVKKGKTPTPNSWSIIANGYLAKDDMEKAFQCMKEAVAVHSKNKEWSPKPNVISRILSWATDNKDIEEVEDFVNSLKTLISVDRNMYLSFIKIYVRCGKEVDCILENMKADNIELDEEIQEVLNSRMQL